MIENNNAYFNALNDAAQAKNKKFEESQKKDRAAFEAKEQKEKGIVDAKAAKDRADLEERLKKSAEAEIQMRKEQELDRKSRLPVDSLIARIRTAKVTRSKALSVKGSNLIEESIKSDEAELEILKLKVEAEREAERKVAIEAKTITGDAKTRTNELYLQFEDSGVARAKLNEEFKKAYDTGGLFPAKYKIRSTSLIDPANGLAAARPKGSGITMFANPDTAWKSRLASDKYKKLTIEKAWSPLRQRVKEQKGIIAALISESNGAMYKAGMERNSFGFSEKPVLSSISLLAEICLRLEVNMSGEAINEKDLSPSHRDVIAEAAEQSKMSVVLKQIIKETAEPNFRIFAEDFKRMVSYINKNWIWIDEPEVGKLKDPEVKKGVDLKVDNLRNWFAARKNPDGYKNSRQDFTSWVESLCPEKKDINYSFYG